MRRGLLLLSYLAILCLSSCGFKEKHEAQEFYNNINHINDTLDRMTSDWHNEFGHARATNNFSSLLTCRTTLGEFISRSRQFINNVAPTSENEKIIADEGSLLEAQASKVSDVYPIFEPMSELTPKETMQKNLRLLGDDLQNEKAGVYGIKNALQLYAKKYGLKK